MAAPSIFGPAAVVETKNAQNFRSILEEHGYWDDTRRLQPIDNSHIAIPVKDECVDTLKHNPATCISTLGTTGSSNSGQTNCIVHSQSFVEGNKTTVQTMKGIPFELMQIHLPFSKKYLIRTPYETLVSAVKELWRIQDNTWSLELEENIPKAWEQHGDMIVLPTGSFTLKEWASVVPLLWLTITKALGGGRLARKHAITSDNFRSPQVELLHGNSSWVEHLDNGIRYSFDITRCMFSAGNITEKLRVARMCCTGETVVDLYAGVGYFSLPYLVHAGAQHVHACEWNPHAILALQKNLQLNRVLDRCTVHEGDNRQVCPRGIADRVNLGLIPSSEPGWPVACAALKPDTGGILHIHSNVTSKKPRLTEGMTSCCETVSNSYVPKNYNDGAQDLSDTDGKLVTWDNKYLDEHLSIEKHVNITSECSVEKGDHVIESEELKCGTCCNSHGTLAELAGKPAWTLWSTQVSCKIRDMLEAAHGGEWRTDVLHIERVKSYAPHIDHLVLDLQCKPIH